MHLHSCRGWLLSPLLTGRFAFFGTGVEVQWATKPQRMQLLSSRLWCCVPREMLTDWAKICYLTFLFYFVALFPAIQRSLLLSHLKRIWLELVSSSYVLLNLFHGPVKLWAVLTCFRCSSHGDWNFKTFTEPSLCPSLLPSCRSLFFNYLVLRLFWRPISWYVAVFVFL